MTDHNRDPREQFHAAVDRYFDTQIGTCRIELKTTALDSQSFSVDLYDPTEGTRR